MSRRKVVVGNWKMYKTVPEAVDFVEKLSPLVSGSQAEVYLAAPFTTIGPSASAVEGGKIRLGAQNMNDASEGAFTGEIAARMLKDVGAHFVVLGHSERRHIFGETSGFINRKARRALADGLEPIVCIGETLEERQGERTKAVLRDQLFQSLEGIKAPQMLQLLIAYEPVWAIGTGHAATSEMAQEVHAYCREIISEKWGCDVGEEIVLLYGGSVKPDNARALCAQRDIDGLLVGGASLDPKSFSQIVNEV